MATDFIRIGNTYILTDHIQAFAVSSPESHTGPAPQLTVSTENRTFTFADPEGEHLRRLVDEFTYETYEGGSGPIDPDMGERRPEPDRIHRPIVSEQTHRDRPDTRHDQPWSEQDQLEGLMSRTVGHLAKDDIGLLERVKGGPINFSDANWWCGMSDQRRAKERPILKELGDTLADRQTSLDGLMKTDPVIGLLKKILTMPKTKVTAFDFAPGAFDVDATREAIARLSAEHLAIHDVEMLEAYYSNGKPMRPQRMFDWLDLSPSERTRERLRIIEALRAGHTDQG